MTALSLTLTSVDLVFQYLPASAKRREEVFLHNAVYDVFVKRVIDEHISAYLFLDMDGCFFRGDEKEAGNALRTAFLKTEKYGGLAGCRRAEKFFCRPALAHLHILLRNSKIGVVISSTWRQDHSTLHLIRDLFGKFAFSSSIIGRTSEFKHLYQQKNQSAAYEKVGRAIEVQSWLERHPKKPFAIIDDSDLGFKTFFFPCFVHVNGDNCFTRENAKKVRQILSLTQGIA